MKTGRIADSLHAKSQDPPEDLPYFLYFGPILLVHFELGGIAPPGKGTPVFRFDQLIRRDMIVRDVKQSHPETIPVFEELGFRSSCDDCDIETVARKYGISSQDVVAALNQAAFRSNAG